MIDLLVNIVIVGLIFWCIWWFIGYIALPDPFGKVVRVLIGLVALIFIINILLSVTGAPLFPMRWR